MKDKSHDGRPGAAKARLWRASLGPVSPRRLSKARGEKRVESFKSTARLLDLLGAMAAVDDPRWPAARLVSTLLGSGGSRAREASSPVCVARRPS
ncbi:hypothetical protein GGTG_04601 [Gaeumannomyces tritici R3-111a-1]|uniref:Uncharacterized protein n=1 Tax=Gaeumannomyces tritici (strain R3-111a-1) TaxID=644352 RepID=J3NTK1_GAET3|nr:hypothetical protein GGTG_04601 [Gaeumannomyces tritici R3-111a-1]EJT79516.1 hypothetical protein GGTG_04601 [Gaeumannomyces tritici R3-111a-1]